MLGKYACPPSLTIHMKMYLCVMYFLGIFLSVNGQFIKNEDLMGKWEINQIKGAHKTFRVTFTFEKFSFLREDINDTLIEYLPYRLIDDGNKTALLLFDFDSSTEDKMAHPLSLKGDTLMIGNYYYLYKAGYNIGLSDSIYFIRCKPR